MNADAGLSPGNAPREIDRGLAAGQVVADQEQSFDTCLCGPPQDRVSVGIEGGIHEMRVRIDQSHEAGPGSGAVLPPMTKVNSPRGACWVKWSSAAADVPRKISSKCLVNSRPMATGRSEPRAATRSFSAAKTR